MEHYSNHDFEVYKEEKGWVYDIYSREYMDTLIESAEYFDSEGEARLAAIGHISVIENGGSND